jgi:hypothetical protein
MVKIVTKKSINLKEPAVIVSLKNWKKIEEIIENIEDTVRYLYARTDPKNQKPIPFKKVKKILKLP